MGAEGGPVVAVEAPRDPSPQEPLLEGLLNRETSVGKC
jgi:hypothetical protein